MLEETLLDFNNQAVCCQIANYLILGNLLHESGLMGDGSVEGTTLLFVRRNKGGDFLLK